MSYLASPFGLLAAASLAGALALASPVAAADLDPGYADVPPQQQVTFGSGWYVRGDIGATENYKVELGRPSIREATFGILKTHDAGYDLSLGGGYAFTNSFRADITADFHQPVTSDLSGQQCIDKPKLFTCEMNGHFDHYDALINGYYDIGTWSLFTPYVGAGVGVGFGEVNANLYGDTNLYSANYGYHSFAWALMAGVGVDVFSHTKLDIGYRYLNNGTVLGTKVYYQEIRAGLRYMIDN